jgi:uncharacterized protein YjiS (DUF1127 family)
MTTNSNPNFAPFGAITTFRIVHFVEGFLRGYHARRRATATEKALHKLSDRELRDIGLDRGAIHDVSRRLAGF